MRANLIFPAVPATYHSKRGAGDTFENTACMVATHLFKNTVSIILEHLK